ncbi:ABC transporter ATP-binding protein [Dictyobacter kobayashii]|uniref:ABC transporter domain-containing protein n=1 Tax=Dictyobacter kobayashii TaxID=2014872 RepID=A0A402AQB9_9CHLR|nr:ABC transporter ATP-binding protein [Dictyobacter kobayashii]GCE21371.1 hypothetical protein KDK_51710 [Dictyobacter kobayashii]
MQESIKSPLSITINEKQEGPIHLPDDGREVAVAVQRLVKTFGKHEAVRDVSFTIGKGEIFGLLGPNGAGKSTTINMMCGYLKPTAGDVSVNGLSLSGHLRAVKRVIGVVPQEIALYKDLNSLENLEFFGKIYGLSKKECRQRAEQLLHFVGLYDRRKDAIETFSGGMQRRINIAIGLINNPDFLMMDEPTVGVDPQSREHIFATIEHIREQGPRSSLRCRFFNRS